ncbi:MAG: response regulator transcription factor [Rhodospirillaceae bacterium]|nr:response regulator transcription factor [Rhodospirillaceae bacterium]
MPPDTALPSEGSGQTSGTVYVVDDDEAVRESLSWLISSVGLKVETYGSAQEFLDAFDAECPACLIVDVRMPGMNGLELQRRLADKSICLPVIVVTGHGDVQMAVHAMKDGAFDFIEKPYNDQAILDQVQKAIAECANRHSKESSRLEVEEMINQLTPREREVMDKIITGETNKTIAQSLSISDKTVEAHRSKVMEKMQSTSMADLMRKALGSQSFTN